MRNMKNIDATGKGKSKEFGFVTFTNHEDALKALRSINNNPNIFSKNRVNLLDYFYYCNLHYLFYMITINRFVYYY